LAEGAKARIKGFSARPSSAVGGSGVASAVGVEGMGVSVAWVMLICGRLQLPKRMEDTSRMAKDNFICFIFLNVMSIIILT
jgi:hypothetical protein